MARARNIAILLVILASSGCGAEGHPNVFIALTRDFAGFESWVTFDRGYDPVPPSHDGTSLIYVDALPEPTAAEFPIGTRIVRIEKVGDDRSMWEVHAMVKRGGSFNAEGSVGWEFFELVLDTSPDPQILWRGEGPVSGDGYRPPDGGTELLGCNHCHGTAVWNDSVLSPVLDLGGLD